MTKRIFTYLPWAIMALLAIGLPFTSSPLVARLTGSTMVAPLALLPMALVLLFWLLPALLIKGRKLPPQVIILGVFLVFTLLSCLAAYFLPIPSYKSQTVISQEIEALLTLGVGIGFYLVFATWPDQPGKAEFLLRWINLGGVIALAWSLTQAGMWFITNTYPGWMWEVQSNISTNPQLFPQRVTGVAFEPSWLAHQLNMLYLPYWLAATVTGYTAHRRLRVGFIHVEHILLIGGLSVLFLSVSRVGWLAFLVMFAYLLLILNLRFIRWTQKKLLHRIGQNALWDQLIRRWFVVAALAILAILYTGLILGAAYVLSQYDPRMAKLFDFSTIHEYSFVYYANQLVFAERIVFWQAGWDVFNDFPILGVGLGNAGFFFPEKLSAFSWALTEIRSLMYQWTTLPNIKSLWVRLLAETGIVGFSFFVSWLYVLWKSGRFLQSYADPLLKTIGIAGAFVIVGLLIEGFSIDTFALPYFWVTFGLLTATTAMARRSSEDTNS